MAAIRDAHAVASLPSWKHAICRTRFLKMPGGPMAAKAEIHRIESIEQFPEFVHAQGWTDGLPVFPPTRKVVADMLDYLGRDPGEVLGTIFPGDGEATVEKIAANCAMAGCLPEYLPVVL